VVENHDPRIVVIEMVDDLADFITCREGRLGLGDHLGGLRPMHFQPQSLWALEEGHQLRFREAVAQFDAKPRLAVRWIMLEQYA
jgi:hypothetical protein